MPKMQPKTLPKGHAWCLGQGFHYTSSVHTDLAKTFARIREAQQQQPKSPESGKVRALPARKG
jgi:hypothetical protein